MNTVVGYFSSSITLAGGVGNYCSLCHRASYPPGGEISVFVMKNVDRMVVMSVDSMLCLWRIKGGINAHPPCII